jgi:tryptophanyl-tRNA synthetase
MEDEEDPRLESYFAEANQDEQTNLEEARRSVQQLLEAVESHRAEVRKLEEDHAAGRLSVGALKSELHGRTKILQKLERKRTIFEQRASALEALLREIK